MKLITEAKRAAVGSHVCDDLFQVLDAVLGEGSYGIARALAAPGVKTARGGDWSDVQVAAVLRR
jgi:hypothetical protein